MIPPATLNPSTQRIAVVGSGIAGLSCAWLLAQRHHVTLFEAEPRLGGHSHSVPVTLDGVTFPVDTGFLVYNDWTYPQLIALFKHLGVATAPSEMSFSVSIDSGAMEWCGADDLTKVFAQPVNALKPRFWSMLRDLLRFNRATTALLDSGVPLTGTLGDYLQQQGYGKSFRDWYLRPMAACIWSSPTQTIDDFPLATFLQFCRNHGLISVNERPKWRTVHGGSINYVNRMAESLSESRADIRLNTPVKCIARQYDQVLLTTSERSESFDQVVLASHSDQSLRMLSDASAAEQSILSGIPYAPNVAVLHTDTTFMPRRKRAWGAWNFHAETADPSGAPVALTYWLNALQPLPFKQTVMVTLNPQRALSPGSELARFNYEHPVYRPSGAITQARLPEIQGVQRTWFAGAWTRYGFHEDGLLSGLAVAQALGVSAPWVTQHDH